MSRQLARSAHVNAPLALANNKPVHALYVWLAEVADTKRHIMLTPADIGREYGRLSPQRITVLLRMLRGGTVDGLAYFGLVAPEHCLIVGLTSWERVMFLAPLDAHGRVISLQDPDVKPKKGLIHGFEVRPPKMPTAYQFRGRDGLEVTRTSGRYRDLVLAPPDEEAAELIVTRYRQRHPERPMSDIAGKIRPPMDSWSRSPAPVFEHAKKPKEYLEAQASGVAGTKSAVWPTTAFARGEQKAFCQTSGNPPEVRRAEGTQPPRENSLNGREHLAEDFVRRMSSCPSAHPQARNAARPPVAKTPTPIAANASVQASLDIANIALTKNRYPHSHADRAHLFHGGNAKGTTEATQAALPRLVRLQVRMGHSEEDVLRGLGHVLRSRNDQTRIDGLRPEPVKQQELNAAIAAATAVPAPGKDHAVETYRHKQAYRREQRQRTQEINDSVAADIPSGDGQDPPF